MSQANRLIHEKSPYLLQHAHNPVNWYPWGPDAFEQARRDDKPIFLSIGYSTCHWCHVMERESFEDAEVAAQMNDAFVSIKVDREERPDVDAVYMNVCQMLTGSGGWPLTIIMTPDQQPFFAATYIPRESRFGRAGMLDLVPQVKRVWTRERERAASSAREIVAALAGLAPDFRGEDLGAPALRAAFEHFDRAFDALHGGFGDAPKFPSAQNLAFLLRYARRTGEGRALAMVEKTLVEMRRGGMYDHLGFGFHRYSTDRRWLVPHFEKMLYDQATLAVAYTEAWQATGKAEYASTAREILAYVQRDMTSPDGAFYSAEDADSEGREGKFYVWSEDEVRQVLSPAQAELALRVYHLTPEGNFSEMGAPPQGENILSLDRSLAEWAARLGLEEAELEGQLEAIRQTLWEHRERRVHPYKDDKVLTDWNGLMIAAFAKAAQAFDEPAYAQAAARAAAFIQAKLATADGRLLHRYRDGESAIAGNLDDYAFLTAGLIELYEATFEAAHLEWALALTGVLEQHFWDEARGGFYFTADDSEKLVVREKQLFDGAVPSGNSVEMLNLLRLARFTGDPHFEERAAQLGRAFSKMVARAPSGFSQLLTAVDFALGPSFEVVIAGDPHAADTAAMLRALRSRFLPNQVVLLRPAAETSPAVARLAPFVREQTSIGGKATAYVCRDFHCDLPTTEVAAMVRKLEEKADESPRSASAPPSQQD